MCGWTNLAFSFVIMGKKLNILCVMVRKSDLNQSALRIEERVEFRIQETICPQIIQS